MEAYLLVLLDPVNLTISVTITTFNIVTGIMHIPDPFVIQLFTE